ECVRCTGGHHGRNHCRNYNVSHCHRAMLALVGSAGRWQSIEMVRAEHSSAAPHAIRYASAKTAAFGMITTPLCLPLAVAPGHTTQREISAPAATRPPPQTTAWGPTTA